MIKGIINSLTHSFFRTIGRILAYLLLGALVAMLLSSKVSAATYTTDSNITATFDNTAYNRSDMESGKTYYHGDKISSSKGFISKTEITGSNRDDDFDFLLPGAYLLDFYVFGDGTITNNLSCDNINSNFGYKDPETGSYVYTSSAMSSKCIEVYNSKYNTLNAVKVLMQINFHGTKDGDYAKYLDLQITNNAYFINKTNYFGVFIGNISDYDQSIVELFHQNALEDMQLNQNQQIIDENKQNTDNIINNQNQNTTDIMDNQNSNTDKVLDSNKETQDKLDENKDAINDMKDSINSNLDDKFNSCRDSYNLLTQPYPLLPESTTKNGLTINVNDDYSITVTGTSTANTYINLIRNTNFLINTVSATSSNRCNNGYCLSSGINFDATNNYYFIRINSGVTVNETYYPMIVKEENKNSAYEKYGVEICTNKLDEQTEQQKETNFSLKTLIGFLNPFSENFFAYKLVELFLNMLKSLFIPEDMDFVTNFVDALESKLGFIAAIPVKIIEFTMSLATATWSEFKSIQLPSISIFGYNFWNSQEIDLTEAINIFKPFKYITDCICVVICARTLNKWREQFTGGGSGK